MSVEITLAIADDHPIMRRGVRDLIGAERGLKVIAQVANGPEALAAIRKHRPVIAVLDVEMGGMNGIEVARALRADGLATSVILLTLYKDEDVFDAAIEAGVRGYVLKENAESDLLTCIRAVAGGQSFFSSSLSQLLLDRAALTTKLRQDKPGLDALTSAEKKILKLIALDKTSKEIAASFGISARTVDSHRANIAEKLGLSGTNCILKFAYDHKSKL